MFRTTKKSQTLLLNEQSRSLEANGKKVYKLGFGQCPFLPPQSVIASLQNHADRKEYLPVQGYAALRQNVASFHAKVDSRTIDPDNILIAPGSKILLYNTMLAFDQASVLIPAPAWVSYAPQAELIGHDVHKLESSYGSRWRVTPDVLEQAIQNCPASNAKFLILNYPGNPEGLTYSKSELEALAEVLRKHDVWVISDEIYGLLHHQGQHVSLATIYPKRTFVTTGLSKWCGAGGWRLGVQILPDNCPAELKEVLLGIASETYSCAPAPVQYAACDAYQWTEEIQAYLDGQRQILSYLGNTIQQQLVGAGIQVHPPEGGFYLLVDFSPLQSNFNELGLHTDQQVCSAILDEVGVALLPGEAFGLAPESLCARLAYVDFDGPAALAALQHNPSALEAICQEHAAHMLEGIDALVTYLTQMQKNASLRKVV